MTGALKADLKRLERLVEIRQTCVDVAESRVKLAEAEVRRLRAAEEEISGKIQDTQAAIAYLQSATAGDVQNRENYIRALEHHRGLIRLSLETATATLEERRDEWREAMRQHKIVAKLRERRLHQWVRQADVAQQKSQDDATVARYVRTRLDSKPKGVP
jgi:flagellar export protein FliJ